MMISPTQQSLADLVAALSHDLRSSLSSVSLTAGLMSTHQDEEVRAFSKRLGRTVSRQTALLNASHKLIETIEGGDSRCTLSSLQAHLESLGLEVSAPLSARDGERLVDHGELVALAVGLAVGGTLTIDVSETVVIRSNQEVPGRTSRATSSVLLQLLGVEVRPTEPGTEFVLP